jgi:Tfp pilus assembly protein PilN
MDEARAVLARLDRIEALEREGAPPSVLLEELRGLVHEAEEWARLEGGERAQEAIERCGAALAAPVT